MIGDNSNADLELTLPQGNTTLSLPDHGTQVASWSFDAGIPITVSNSTLGDVDFDILPGSHVTLTNSTNSRFGWGMGWRPDLEGNNRRSGGRRRILCGSNLEQRQFFPSGVKL